MAKPEASGAHVCIVYLAVRPESTKRINIKSKSKIQAKNSKRGFQVNCLSRIVSCLKVN